MDPTAFWTALSTVATLCLLVTGAMATTFGVIVARQGRRIARLEAEVAECERQRRELTREKIDLLVRLTDAEHDRRAALQVKNNLLELRRKQGPNDESAHHR